MNHNQPGIEGGSQPGRHAGRFATALGVVDTAYDRGSRSSHRLSLRAEAAHWPVGRLDPRATRHPQARSGALPTSPSVSHDAAAQPRPTPSGHPGRADRLVRGRPRESQGGCATRLSLTCHQLASRSTGHQWGRPPKTTERRLQVRPLDASRADEKRALPGAIWPRARARSWIGPFTRAAPEKSTGPPSGPSVQRRARRRRAACRRASRADRGRTS